ncbi:unnamed protein product [Cochlearia groenlandica]
MAETVTEEDSVLERSVVDDDYGLRPSDFFVKHKWKIEKFSENKKREIRSSPFETGGFKWYILIYPQGCDVSNHLSLFLRVANEDQLFPGWSHLAQFTIALKNRDPKKTKFADTIHRFCKKEHDWGWKCFIELPKLHEGYIHESDSLIIDAQVQFIREWFMILGFSFGVFWLGMDQNTRRRMSREKMDVILKRAVNRFFIEEEVTSTLLMDSFYSGLKAIESQTKTKKAKELPAPMVSVDKDMFVLVDDLLLLVERAAAEPLPPIYDKGPQNRTMDGINSEEVIKEANEHDERHLTELGRRTLEMCVLVHIRKNIDDAYERAIAHEELIRKEATEIEKKSKKKQE